MGVPGLNNAYIDNINGEFTTNISDIFISGDQRDM